MKPLGSYCQGAFVFQGAQESLSCVINPICFLVILATTIRDGFNASHACERYVLGDDKLIVEFDGSF